MGTLANRLFSRKTSTSSNHEAATDSGSSSPVLSHSSVFAEKPTSGSVKQRKTLRAMKSSSTTSAGSLSSRDSSFKKRSQSIHSSGKQQQQQQQQDEKTTTTLWIYNQVHYTLSFSRHKTFSIFILLNLITLITYIYNRNLYTNQ